MKGEYIVNAWNIVTLLVSTSWFQFQVFRSFIQTELIRKNLWNHHLEWKKRIFFYKWMLHTFYPPPQKKKRMVQIWHQNSHKIFQCFETWHLFWGSSHPKSSRASSKRGLEWWALIPAKNLEGSGGWINKGYWRQPWIPYDLDMMGRYFTGLNWRIHPPFHHFLKKKNGQGQKGRLSVAKELL